jgi:hypothetical protein
MKYWMDTEFIERPYTIDLISIGLVAEDGREFYADPRNRAPATQGRWNAARGHRPRHSPVHR